MAQDTSPKPSLQSSEQMFASIKASMELLVVKVSAMEEILVALQQDYIRELDQEMT